MVGSSLTADEDSYTSYAEPSWFLRLNRSIVGRLKVKGWTGSYGRVLVSGDNWGMGREKSRRYLGVNSYPKNV